MLRQSFIQYSGVWLVLLGALIGCEEGPPPMPVQSEIPESQGPSDESNQIITKPVVLTLDDVADESEYVSAQRGTEAMRRLTRPQFILAVKRLLGDDIVVPAIAEPDVARGGLRAIGASSLTYSSRGVESLETAAFDVAKQALETDERRKMIVPCTPSSTVDNRCAGIALKALATRAWRRPVKAAELEGLVDVTDRSSEVLGDFYDGLVYGIAGILQSPYFLFRIEFGEEAPTRIGNTGPCHCSWADSS